MKVNVFKSGTCTKESMARLRNILAEHDDIHDYVKEKFARIENQFNPDALHASKEDDSYVGEEPGMSEAACETHEADNIIANTGINPLMFEEGIDTEARMNVLHLHSLANGFDEADISESELAKRDEIDASNPSNPHYRLMEVKKCTTDYGAALMNGEENGRQLQYTRKFYWNGTEGYETYEANMDSGMYDEDTEDDYKNQEKQEHERKQKVAVQLLYKKLKESKAGMKQAYNQKHYQLAQEFRKEFEYCSKALDAIKACDEKAKQAKIKSRKDKLYTNWIKYSNLGGKLTVEDVKAMINNKSLSYAEKVIENKLRELQARERAEQKTVA